MTYGQDRNPYRVLVTGDRNWNNVSVVDSALRSHASKGRPLHVIEGGAKGADSLAALWAKANQAGHTQVKADWKSAGRAAGPIRNKQMLKYKPNAVLAFHDDLNASKGTRNMVNQALKDKRGILVEQYRSDGSSQRLSTHQRRARHKRRQREAMSKGLGDLGDVSKRGLRIFQTPPLEPGEQDRPDSYSTNPRDISERDTAFAGTRYRRGYTRHAPQDALLGQPQNIYGREAEYKSRKKKWLKGERDSKSLWYQKADQQHRSMEELIRRHRNKHEAIRGVPEHERTTYDEALANEGQRRANEWNKVTGVRKSYVKYDFEDEGFGLVPVGMYTIERLTEDVPAFWDQW